MTDSWWPEGYQDPAFVVQRQSFGVEEGGDYVRGSSVTTLPHTALRYPTLSRDFNLVAGKGFLGVRAFDYTTAEVMWGWPINLKEEWLEVALVRSGFGDPTTVNDGQTLFHAVRADFVDTDGDGEVITPPPIVYDKPLQSGHWYYYSLFFKTTPLDWVLAMSGNVLLPRNYEHAKHLWTALPPFYQMTDSNIRENTGPLRQFLTMFGFELDTIREYVESWQETYHIDTVPQALLKRVGENFGEPYRSGFGPIRYRSLIAALPEALSMRGTNSALEQIVTSISKWSCDITTGDNLLLLPDDSDFFYGTGSWGRLHPGSDPAYPYAYVLTDDVFLVKSPAMTPPTTNGGRGVMEVFTEVAQETLDLVLACGCGYANDMREVIPLYTAVPIEPASTYGFSIQVRMDVVSPVTVQLLWYDKDGKPADLLTPLAEGTAAAPPAGGWQVYQVQGAAPVDAVYVVPALRFTGRLAGPADPYSPKIYLAGASLYFIGSGASVTVAAPDTYLTLGDPAEKLAGPTVLGGTAT